MEDGQSFIENKRRDYLVRAASLVFVLFLSTLFLPLRALTICAILIAAAVLLRKPIADGNSYRRLFYFVIFSTSALLLNLVSVLYYPGRVYIFDSRNGWDCLLVHEEEYHGNKYLIIPSCGSLDVKAWLHANLGGAPGNVIVLSSRRVEDDYIIESPTERALVEIEGRINHSYWGSMLLMGPVANYSYSNVESPSGLSRRLSISRGYSFLSLGTNIGPQRPGLFGVRVSQPPEHQDWNRVARNEELIRLFQVTQPSDIISYLEEDFRQSGIPEDLIRFLAIRLNLVWQQYPDFHGQPNSPNIMTLSKLGNLSYVLDKLSHIQVSQDLYDSPWLPFLQGNLETYVGRLSAELPQVTEETRNFRVLREAQALLREIEAHNQNSFDLSDSRQDEGAQESELISDAFDQVLRQSQSEDAASILRAIEGLVNAQRSDEEAEIWNSGQVTARLSARAICESGNGANDPFARLWLDDDVPDRSHRAYWVIDCALDSADALQVNILRAVLSDPSDLNASLYERSRQMFSVGRDLAIVALEMIEDPLAKEYLRNGVMRRIEFMEDRQSVLERFLTNCLGSDFSEYQFFEACLSDVLFAVSSAEHAQMYDAALRNRDGFLRSFLEKSIGIGRRYSENDFLYVVAIDAAMYDRSATSVERSHFCQKVRSDFIAVLNEDHVEDRAAIINLQAQGLTLCGTSLADRADALLRRHGLPRIVWMMPGRYLGQEGNSASR